MKKRMYVYLLIFSVCLFHLLIPSIVFGQANVVFGRYENTFMHPDVGKHFPDVLRAFRDPHKQLFLNSSNMNRIVDRPRTLRNFAPEAHDSILILLLLDEEFQALFRDEDFQDVVRDTVEINRLVNLIPPPSTIPGDSDCEIPETEPSEATVLLIVSGYSQEDEPGDTLDEPFVVEVQDQYGVKFFGTNVVFRVTQGGGSLSAETVPIRNGRAQTTLTLGSNAGVNVVEASVSGIPLPQVFTAIAVASPPTEPVEPEPVPLDLTKVSGNNQMGTPNALLGHPFVVLVSDADGNGVPNIGVRFSVPAGDGELSDETAITDDDGRAETTLTFGSSGGSILVGASIAGFGVTQVFTATATGPAEPIVSAQLPPMYWVENGALYYRPTSGEKRMLLKPRGASLTGGLAVDIETRRVYWTEQTDETKGRVRWFSLDDMKVRLLAEVVDGVPQGVTVGTDKSDKRRVYWTTSHGKIQRINDDGSDFRPNFLTGLNSPKHIAFDFDEEQRRLYWTEEGRIRNANPNGTKKIWVAQGLGELGGIAVADGVVYWTEKAGNGQGRVKSINGSGSNPKLLAVLASVPEGITVDAADDRVYWTTSRGEIQSVSLDREPVEIVAEGVGKPVGIALGRLSSEPSMMAAAPSINSVDSVESALLANYPNPFNPETWIPYQLSKAGNVTVSIYSVNGALIRTLALGHQAAGTYRSRSRAAYWDGRNEFGERVASGLYFYTLTAGDFTATRKMLIRK